MYVLLVRPQQRKVREQRELVRRVGVGAEVQTIGGILGRVVAADDEYVHLEISPGVVVTFVRAAVGRILEAAPDDAVSDDTLSGDAFPDDLSGETFPGDAGDHGGTADHAPGHVVDLSGDEGAPGLHDPGKTPPATGTEGGGV